MAIKIEAPEVEPRIREAAAQSGIPVEEYVLHLVIRHLPSSKSGPAVPSKEVRRKYGETAATLRQQFQGVTDEDLEQRIDQSVRTVREQRKLTHHTRA